MENKDQAVQQVLEAETKDEQRFLEAEDESKHIFPFLEMPAELRDVVYHELLEGGCRVVLAFKLWWHRGPHARLKLEDGCEPNISTSILSVNKQIRNEALPILYGTNSFHALSPSEIISFTNKMGDAVQHLRHVGFARHTTKKDIKAMLLALKPAKQLSTLSLPCELVINSAKLYRIKPVYNATTLAKELTPLFRGMNRYQKKDGERKERDLSQILSIHTENARLLVWYDENVSTVEDNAKATEERVKSLLAKALKEANW